MKVLITGGHLTPALAVIGEMKDREQKKTVKYELVFVGRKYSYEGEDTISQEYQIITAKGIRFISLPAGKLPRHFSKYFILSILKIPLGFISSFFLINKEKPDIILSFGGYLGLPISLAGWIWKIPIITHEQTTVPGLSNKIISQIAAKICLSYPDTLKQFSQDKIVLTGNPLRKEIFQNNKPKEINIPENAKILYVTGGNLGSHALNVIIEPLLEKLLDKWFVIHQCGESAKYHDRSILESRKRTLSLEKQNNYFLKSYFGDDEIGWIMNQSHLIISRSGANTISELIALGKPAILIPLPWSGGNEQLANARMAHDIGIAEIIIQDELTPQKLWETLEKMDRNYYKYTAKRDEIIKNNFGNAAVKIVDVLDETGKKNLFSDKTRS